MFSVVLVLYPVHRPFIPACGTRLFMIHSISVSLFSTGMNSLSHHTARAGIPLRFAQILPKAFFRLP